MKINVVKVLADAKAKREEVKPLPKIRIVSGGAVHKPVEQAKAHIQEKHLKIIPFDTKALLLEELETEMWRIRKDRMILSSQNHKLVSECEAKLRKESEAVAEEFLKGNVPMPELAGHYAKMQALTDKATGVFDKIEHVKLYGVLPGEKQVVTIDIEQSDNVKVLTYEVRRLDDMISKTYKKINGYKPKNIERMVMWKEKVALAEAQRDEVKHKIKTLQYEARTNRQNKNSGINGI